MRGWLEMPKKTFTYEATIRISVKVEAFDGAQIARRIALSELDNLRGASDDHLYGEAKVSGGSLRRVITRKAAEG